MIWAPRVRLVILHKYKTEPLKLCIIIHTPYGVKASHYVKFSEVERRVKFSEIERRELHCLDSSRTPLPNPGLSGKPKQNRV